MALKKVKHVPEFKDFRRIKYRNVVLEFRRTDSPGKVWSATVENSGGERTWLGMTETSLARLVAYTKRKVGESMSLNKVINA